MLTKHFRIIFWFLTLCFTTALVVPDFSVATAQTTTGKKKRLRKKRSETLDTGAVPTGDAAADGTQVQSTVKKNQFGLISMVGYQMTFADLEMADGTTKSYTTAGLDISGVARYKLNLKSVAIPIDVGIDYMTMGRVEDDGEKKTEYNNSMMFLTMGSGVEIVFGKSALPFMLYFDYKLSDSQTVKSDAGTESFSNIFASMYRLKLQTGYVYSMSFFRLGAAVGAHLLGFTPKQIANETVKSKSWMGVYFGLLLGAEF